MDRVIVTLVEPRSGCPDGRATFLHPGRKTTGPTVEVMGPMAVVIEKPQ